MGSYEGEKVGAEQQGESGEAEARERLLFPHL